MDESQFIRLLKKLGQGEVNTYFTYTDRLIKALGIAEGDIRVTFNTPKEGNRLAFIIGNRYTFAYFKKRSNQWEFINSQKIISSDKITVEQYDGSPEAYMYKCNSADEISKHFEEIVKACEIELSRSNFSKYREYLNPTFEKAVFHPTYRDELFKTAFNTESMTPENKLPMNTILYGPPGTGKTYHTVNKALEILGEDISNLSRKEIKEAFDEKVKNEQVVFTTFHQSMSYEDFIEGIKPIINETSSISYDIEPGIFTKTSTDAKENWLDANQDDKAKLPFEEAFDQLKDDWSEDAQMKFPLKTVGKEFTILGFTNTSIRFKKSSGGTGHTLSISTLRDFYYNKRNLKPSGVGIYYPPVIEKLNSYHPSSIIKKEVQPYVLIIDEINRGNVSQIFGELITLIEEDKRLGKPEALEVTLPYSKEKFGVPPNLYIIGTMNTADRSVEALDTALRRRFSFIEMPPQPALLTPSYMVWRLFWDYENHEWDDPAYKPKESQLFDLLGATENFRETEKENLWDQWKKAGRSEKQMHDISEMDFSGINLSDLLNTINKRIEKLLDPDHLIGHSYFMEVFSLGDLKAAFQNKIIPLLQEYFYGDYGKIGLVLGKGFFDNEGPENENGRDVFAEFNDYDASAYVEKPVYKLRKVMEMSDDAFLEALDLLYNK